MNWNLFHGFNGKKAGGWKNVWRMDAEELHTMPVNDTMEHEMTDDCPCRPKNVPVERDDGSIGWQVIHNAKDGRE